MARAAGQTRATAEHAGGPAPPAVIVPRPSACQAGGVDALHDTDLPDRTDVVVVGAGLAGLACARGLRRRGLDVLVVDGAEAVGGRVRTDVVDGFLVDRGFQILNTSYPALRAAVDLDALDLHPFVPGAAVRTEDGALRRVALTYAAGIAVVQVFWIAFLFLPSSAAIPVFVK